MKYSIIYTSILSIVIGLTGCGGGSDDTSQNCNQGSNHSNTENGGNSELTEAQRQKILNVSKETSPIALKEALLSGIIDTIIYGADEAEKDEKCSSGNYTKTGDVITFNNCTGLFKAVTGLNQSQDLSANGKVIVKEESNEYQNLILVNTVNAESKIVNGILKFSGEEPNVVVTTDKLTIKATEKTANSFTDVNYTLDSYKLNYDIKSGSELSLTTTGTLTATNSKAEDYKVKFETTQPLFVAIVKKKDEYEVVSYPYAGVLKITDLLNSATTTITANNDKKTAFLNIITNQKELSNGTQNWVDILE